MSKRNAADQVMVSGVFTAKLPPKCLVALVCRRFVSFVLPRLLIAQEALNHVVKRAQARRVTLALQLTPPPAASECGTPGREKVVLRIVDDGCGFAVGRVAVGHLGPGGMRERAAVLAAGCDDFIRKPFRDSEIFAALARRAAGA